MRWGSSSAKTSFSRSSALLFSVTSRDHRSFLLVAIRLTSQDSAPIGQTRALPYLDAIRLAASLAAEPLPNCGAARRGPGGVKHDRIDISKYSSARPFRARFLHAKEEWPMATAKQKTAARHNLERARDVQSARAHGKRIPKLSEGISTHQENRMPEDEFAFPEQRKEPIHDAAHVRNAIARFDQVEDVSDADRDAAWKRIVRAAKKYDIEVEAESWRDLMKGGKAGKR